MKYFVRSIGCLFLLNAIVAFAAETTSPESKNRIEWQYQSGDIRIPAAVADEPMVASFGDKSIRAAAKYLDDGALAWTREKTCVACHTPGVYMAERPGVSKLLGRPNEEVLARFIASVPKSDPVAKITDGKKVFAGGSHYAVWRSLGLAEWDKCVSGELSEHTQRSLRDMLLRQSDNGLWPVGGKVEIPYQTTDFELGVQAARAIVTAPGWFNGLRDAELLERIDRLKKTLREHQPRNDYEHSLQLQLASSMPELISADQRTAAIEMLWRHQRLDGGWSTRSMSNPTNWGERMADFTLAILENASDSTDPASDPYMTAFAIILLRESGVQIDDDRIQRGVLWLKSNQRESGRWWMKSLYKDTYHYITYIATAKAIKALAACNEIPDLF